MPKVVKVAVPPLGNEYNYLLPEELNGILLAGDQIEVNFNGRRQAAYILDISDKSKDYNYSLKEISNQVSNVSCFSPEQLKFFRWISSYYQEPLAKIIDLAVPKISKSRPTYSLSANKSEATLRGKLQKVLFELIVNHKNGILEQDVIKKHPTARPAIKALIKKDLISRQPVNSHYSAKIAPTNWAKKSVELNPEQIKALDAVCEKISKPEFHPFLLYGVTGSGKTEVYLDAACRCLEENKGVLFIVPEIALTPQLIDRFSARLGNNFAVLHSAITPKEKWKAWQALLKGEIRVAIGVRSAIFAPVPDLGLIVVDEEHESSYKQSDNFRYHARDLAVKRAQLSNCPVILGSATPTLESIYNVQSKKYTLLKLLKRHSAYPTNSIQIINTKKLRKKDYASKNITKTLQEKIEEHLKKQQQIFLLHNRRGFASYLECKECSEPMRCTACDITLTFYKDKARLQCHHCGFRTAPPLNCPNCKNENEELGEKIANWVQRGAGTEKIHIEIEKLFPKARIARLDRDQVNTAKQYRDILDAVRNHEVDILVGTQMIAKGHDLPSVTLVGVIDCDVGLHMPDFRASEKSFQLLTQVAGRAGRSEVAGEVFFQTRSPEHPSLVFASNSDYLGFVNHELRQRKALGYPPFSGLLRIIVSATNPDSPEDYLKKAVPALKEFIDKKKLSLQILGPAAAPLNKLRHHWRWHILVKGMKIKELQQIAFFFQEEKKKQRNLRIAIDLNPQDLM